MDAMEFLRGFLNSRSMTPADLKRRLQISSNTTVSRLLNGRAGEQAWKSFETLFCSSGIASIPEQKELRAAIETTFYASSRDAVYAEMRRFILGKTLVSNANITLKSDLGSLDLIDYILSKEKLTLYVINCTFTSIAAHFPKILEAGIQLRHYIEFSDDLAGFMRTLNAVAPVLSFQGYECFNIKGLSFGLKNTNCLLLSYGEQKDIIHEIILFDSELSAVSFVRNVPSKFILPDSTQAPSFKSSELIFNVPKLFYAYCNQFKTIEHNCVIYDMKPDPCAMLIPTNVLCNAFAGGSMPPDVVNSNFFADLYHLFLERYNNIEQKSQDTFVFLKKDALQRFAESGKTLDHMPGMRPYNADERKFILRSLLKRFQSNSAFHIVFLDDESLIPNRNLCCYIGRGLYIGRADDNYIGNSFGNAVQLTPPEAFYGLFQQYCKEELIKQHALPKSDVIAFLNELLQRIA